MAGHSHWSNIQHKKGIEDKKRSALFSRLSKEVAIAVKQGGSDPKNNIRLQAAIEKARKANMPKEKIDIAIDRAMGIGKEGKLEQVLYEVYGPQKSAFLIEISTDNKNRTASEFKHLVHLAGGSFAQAGSVKWMFDQLGKISITMPQGISEEGLELKMIDLGAQDFAKDDGRIIIYVSASMLGEVEKEVKVAGIDIEDASLVWKPKSPVKIFNKDIAQKILEFEEELKSYQDTERVFSNIEYGI